MIICTADGTCDGAQLTTIFSNARLYVTNDTSNWVRIVDSRYNALLGPNGDCEGAQTILIRAITLLGPNLQWLRMVATTMAPARSSAPEGNDTPFLQLIYVLAMCPSITWIRSDRVHILLPHTPPGNARDLCVFLWR